MAISKFNLDEFDFDIEESSVKYCKKCKTKNTINAKFCLECGCTEFVNSLKKSNAKYCVKCKTKLELKSKFCFNCGGSDFVDSLDAVDSYYVKEADLKWQEELDKINKKIDKTNKEIKELKLKKDDYLTKIKKLKNDWEIKINSLSNENINTLNKANSYNDESSGYVKKIAKLKEQVETLEKKYEELSNKQKVTKTKSKEIDNAFGDIMSIFGGSSDSPNIFQYVFNKSPQQMYNQAEKLERQGEYELAFLVYQEAAKKEHAAAQNRLGCIYYTGMMGFGPQAKYCDIDYNKSIEWFTKSADNGYYYGMLNAGKFYLEGKNGSIIIDKAIKWLEKSLKAKCNYKADSYYYLGRCYESYYHKNEAKCLKYYETAANFEAYKRLAYIYYEGVFGYKDNTKALSWAEKAYGDGYYDPNGEVGNLLGKLYLYGKGITSNSKKAYNLFNKAAIENRNTDAYYNLALCYLNGYGIPKNKTKAKEYLDIAAKRGHSLAINKLKEL